MTVFVPSQTLISTYFVVVPTQWDLSVKKDQNELDPYLEMGRSNENRNHMSSLKYIVPVYYLILQSLSLEIDLPYIILIFASTFVCKSRLRDVFI